MDMALLFFALVWGLLRWTPFGRRYRHRGHRCPKKSRRPRFRAAGGTAERSSKPATRPHGLRWFRAACRDSLDRAGSLTSLRPQPSSGAPENLVGPLWARGGKGSHRTEQTGGRWITYQAQVMASGRNGVVAYRMKRTRPRPLPSAPSVPMVTPAPPRRATLLLGCCLHRARRRQPSCACRPFAWVTA